VEDTGIYKSSYSSDPSYHPRLKSSQLKLRDEFKVKLLFRSVLSSAAEE